ncbi:MAG: hypothetical protein Q8J92_14275 [Parvibaculum sp.]|nr:hypothetical protein [Parvibaculum sp.]
MVALALIGTGFLTVALACVFTSPKARAGRIVIVSGTALMLAGTLLQTFAAMF